MGRGKRSQSTAIALVQRQLLVSWVAKSHFSQKWTKLKENLHFLFALLKSLEFWTLLQLCSFISLASLSASAFFSSSWVKGLQDHESGVDIAKSRKVSTIINVNHGKPHLGDVSDVDIVQHDRSSLSTTQPTLECNNEFISKANIQAEESYLE